MNQSDQRCPAGLEVSTEGRGKLKIFLGYCAGVGKTYRMLQDGIFIKNTGQDVMIGIVETHGRVDTQALVGQLPVFPRKEIRYAGSIPMQELDLDAILTRHPQLVLVDELAHTNVPGARHTKRYQDVEELLNAGINVYTTLNIQHVQNLGDIIYQITTVKVEETIPNWVLESASEVELVDLSPEKLQQRLRDGKVYLPHKAQVAMQQFFKKGNLLALRELSLKYLAKRVDVDLLSYRAQAYISEVWPIGPKILVGMSTHKSTERALLTAQRMAEDLEAEWYAVHVESLQQVRYTEKSRNQLHRNIRLAEELGAKVVALSGNNVAEEVIKFAKHKNVTLIIVGLSQRSRWQDFLRGSILNALVKKASPINLLVVGNDQPVRPHEKQSIKSPLSLRPYALGMMGVLGVAILGALLPKWFFAGNFLMTLLLPTIIAGILGGVAVGLCTSLMAISIYDLFFVPPLKSFAVNDLRYLSNFLFFVLIVMGVSWVARMVRWRAESAKYRERFVYALYNFSREILSAQSAKEILNRALRGIMEVFEVAVVIMLAEEERGELVVKASSAPDLLLNEMEQAVAFWVYKNGHHAGKGTNTLSSAHWHYLPLKTRESVLGVICLQSRQQEQLFSPEQRRLLEAFSGVIALALTRVQGR